MKKNIAYLLTYPLPKLNINFFLELEYFKIKKNQHKIQLITYSPII